MDNKIQNEPKKFRLPLLKSWEQKKRVLGAKAGCCACPLHTSPKRWADHLSYPSSPTLRHIPVVVVQLLSRIQLFASPWTTACQAPLSTAISWSFVQIPLSWWCHPTISSSVVPFSSCPQSFSASGSFPVSWLFTSGGQSIGASASASVLPMDIQGWVPLGLTGLISLLSKRLSRIFSCCDFQK